jgi:hypothetical protein
MLTRASSGINFLLPFAGRIELMAATVSKSGDIIAMDYTVTRTEPVDSIKTTVALDFTGNC